MNFDQKTAKMVTLQKLAHGKKKWLSNSESATQNKGSTLLQSRWPSFWDQCNFSFLFLFIFWLFVFAYLFLLLFLKPFCVCLLSWRGYFFRLTTFIIEFSLSHLVLLFYRILVFYIDGFSMLNDQSEEMMINFPIIFFFFFDWSQQNKDEKKWINFNWLYCGNKKKVNNQN